MASNAFSGVGTEFRRWSGSAWEKQAEINSIDGPSMSRDTIDVTSLDTEDGYREFITSFRDGGEVQLTMNFTRATYDVIKADFESDDKQNYEIVLPDDEKTSVEFTGLVTNCPISIAADDKVTANVTIKVSGKVTINSGSGS